MFKFELHKISHLVFSAVISFAGTTAFAGGDFVNNGGGLAEKNILYAYEKLESFIQLCLGTDSCKLNATQNALLEKIYQSLAVEKKAQNQIVFSSEKQNPGSFMIDGNVRVAKTGDAVGSPIYINSDLLYTKNGGGYDPVTIPEAAAILIHELGHHQGAHTHEELDLIGVRVSLLLQQKFITTPLVPWSPYEISASVLNLSTEKTFPQVLLSVGDEVVDVSAIYAKEVHCEVVTLPIPILPIPDLELVTKTPTNSIFHNVHWEKIKDKGDYISVKITGNVSNTCQYTNNIGIRNNNYQLSISFTINKIQGRWVTNKASITMDQFKDPWWKLIRLPGQ